MDPDRLFDDLKDAHQTGAHVGLGNINDRMRAVFGDEYALVVETAPDAGMKIILKIPKYSRGVRTNLTLVQPSVEDTSEQPVIRA
jgi:two-component system LytT family sensor kinase